MLTNAQAALQAAATLIVGTGAPYGMTVTDVAEQFKAWLDKHDEEPEPEPELSHHITCASRMQFRDKPHVRPCDCTPIPYAGTQLPMPPYVAHREAQ
jgi:hypothetical protein